MATAELRLERGLTVQVARAGGFDIVQIPGYGTACPEIAAKITVDGRTVAIVHQPLARWNKGFGGWYQSEEWSFEDDVKQLAEHYGGTVEMR